ncbi:MAG: glycosyltransferase [Wolinella sp.]
MGSRFSILLAIRSLDKGGAERQMVTLSRALVGKNFDVTLVVLVSGGALESELKNSYVKLISLDKKKSIDFAALNRLRILIKEEKFNFIYSFLPEMNIFCLLASRFLLKAPKIIWGFRSSDMDIKSYGFKSRVYYKLERILSPFADMIIANSNHSLKYHESIGYTMNKTRVIHNGIDTFKFSPNSSSRHHFRERLGIKNDEIVIGISARLDKAKGYPVLAHAAKGILEKNPRVRFLAAGLIEPNIYKECMGILGTLSERFSFLGLQDDISAFYNSLDILVSSSLTESFSNSIAEGMACGVVPVVSAAGDSPLIVGDVGEVVKVGDSHDLEQKLSLVLEYDLKAEGKRARERIVQLYSVNEMINKTIEAVVQCAES